MHLMQVTPFGDRCLRGQFSALGQRLGLTKRRDKHFRPLVLPLWSSCWSSVWCSQVMMCHGDHKSWCSLWNLCGIQGSGFLIHTFFFFFFGYSLCSFSFLKNYFLLTYSCFTMLCWFILYNKMNQPYVYVYPLPFGLPPHSGHHRALSGVPCAIPYVLISYLFYTW